MSKDFFATIAGARIGYVEAPAGCGKTEAIARSVAECLQGMQLVLTHTLAGVNALRTRFRVLGVAAEKYNIDTIAGWAWGWVRKYPKTASYDAATDIPVWDLVYPAATRLLDAGFVRSTIASSYSGLLVDEYQDCTRTMHQLLRALSEIVPCRVLGDELQGVFSFGEQLVAWGEVRSDYLQSLGSLNVPYRWIVGGNKKLGEWILAAREALQQGREPNYDGAPIIRRKVNSSELTGKILGIVSNLKGSVCIVRAKNRRLAPGLETMLARRGYRMLEANELPYLRKLVEGLSQEEKPKRAAAAFAFITSAFGNISSERGFVKGILNGNNLRPANHDRKMLVAKHPAGVSTELIYDLLSYLETQGGVHKLLQSTRALRCILERHRETGLELRVLFATEVHRRKYDGREEGGLCVGSTLLVKGLQFEHVVVIRNANWLENKWGDHRDLYVALSRGAQSVTLVDVTS